MSGVEFKRKLISLGKLEIGNICYSKVRFDKYGFRHEWSVISKDSRYVHVHDFVHGIDYWLPKNKMVYTTVLSFPEGMGLRELKGVQEEIVNVGK